MRDERIREKVQIFISSSCAKKYKAIRRSLKLLLLETNICDVFVFEDERGSTQDVITTYMEPLERAELIIVIVDNEDNITDATLTEINRARELKKKCLFVFCDEEAKIWTSLQEELTSGLNERYIVVHEFSRIPEEVYESVMRDIVSIYHLYCRGKFKKNDVQEITVLSEEPIIGESKYVIKKDLTQGYEYTKHLLNTSILFAMEETKDPSALDKICSSILEVVIGNKESDTIDFSKLKEELRTLHTEKIYKVIEKRVNAMEAYWKGDIQNSINMLNHCIDGIQSDDDIPNWLKNDVAIDLRNLQIIEDNFNNKIDIKTKGQRVLNESEESVYFPILDRYISDYNEQVAKDNISFRLDSPYTVRLGGLNFVTDKLCDTFIISILYGSITHSTMIRKRMQLLLTGACIEYREHKMFILLVKQMLLEGNQKELEKFLRTYGEYTDNINSDDVSVLENAVDKINIQHRKLISKLLLFQNFGYYFSDEKYDSFTNGLIDEINYWLEKQFAIIEIGNCLFKSLTSNAYRMDTVKILSICYRIFQNKYKRWYDDVFKVIQVLPLDKINMDEQRYCVNWIILCIEDEEIRLQCNTLGDAIQKIRVLCKIKQKTIDNKVKKYMLAFYESTYSLNILSPFEKNNWKYIKDYIDYINTDNVSQGKNGIYTGQGVNSYRTIRNILCNDKMKLNSNQIEDLLNALQGTLLAERQLTSAKVDALELLIYLKIVYPRNKSVNIIAGNLKENYHLIVQSHDDFMINCYNNHSLKFVYEMFKLVSNNSDYFALLEVLSDMQQESESIRIISLTILGRLLTEVDILKLEKDLLRLIVEYVISLSKSTERDTRLHAGITLILLLDTDYRQLILKRISSIMNGDTYEIKVALLIRLGKRNLKDEIVQFIFQKGKVDNHYLVRQISQKYFTK
nr:hypothetical protein [uncultured Anaerosporobacter sp.]